ncbi:hypothetical protein X808_3010 [Mannheimia varigena USDA-ARS-USMARC-1296]|uniref:Uncharacterized protein n=1 Tax=Mannheimia varigena USDA-ARS-USMARC-1296 TaxID=1433287 RepID=W0QC84_9PAST|nr:hypothetical protein X808_3010 [Mannheimia varigena USDA-ARS-USMARC-1296]
MYKITNVNKIQILEDNHILINEEEHIYKKDIASSHFFHLDAIKTSNADKLDFIQKMLSL